MRITQHESRDAQTPFFTSESYWFRNVRERYIRYIDILCEKPNRPGKLQNLISLVLRRGGEVVEVYFPDGELKNLKVRKMIYLYYDAEIINYDRKIKHNIYGNGRLDIGIWFNGHHLKNGPSPLRIFAYLLILWIEMQGAVSVLEKLIPELQRMMMGSFNPSVTQLSNWFRSIHKHKRNRL
ncbi:hypothetical protein RhiirC2_706457 [Rhizophagus irregularis]|uniref:Uncharacterized protein n=1 Tax=Rhizophagus irregularis TaxID=588596 RepID=A0A2N1NUN7_9GLOM|nr:hypothetical protein RhiirC2_706457 [Rhizophagus irregularis]